MITVDQIRDQLFDRERMRWTKITSPPSAIGRLLQMIFGKNPAEGFYIIEHEAADADTGECVGEILQAWRLDSQGLCPVEPQDVDPGRTIGRMWQYQLVRYFISDDNEHIFLNEMDGPKQGMLIYMTPQMTRGSVTLKVVQAAPILGGYSIG